MAVVIFITISYYFYDHHRDTILTMDEPMTEEEVIETLKAHKQIIANVKTQTWPMHRKLKVCLVTVFWDNNWKSIIIPEGLQLLHEIFFFYCYQVLRKAKIYIKKHEGELKQSKQAKDIMPKVKVYFEKVNLCCW